jgi:membrane protein required for colicin V production
MNWLDWTLLAILAIAAIRGFFRGFVVELASLAGIVLGIWAASRYNEKVAAWVGLGPDREVISFAITFLAVVVLAHLLAKLITKGLDLAQMGLPNKVAGVFFGVLRSAFILSVLVNILVARAGGREVLGEKTRTGSALYGPVRAFAPLIVPALGESKWLEHAIDEVKGEAGA